MKHLCLTIWLSLIFLLVGCSFVLKTSKIPSDDSLFNQSDCGFPCWKGLIPGQTTGDNIHQQLQEIEFVSKTNLHENIDGNSLAIRWWHSAPQQQSRLIVRDNVLSSIEIVPHIKFTFEDILSAYGEPTAVIARLSRTDTGYYLVTIYTVYPEIGAIFQFELENETQPYVIKDDIDGKEFYLFQSASSLDEFTAQINILDGQNLNAEPIILWSDLGLPFIVIPNPDTYLKSPILRKQAK